MYASRVDLQERFGEETVSRLASSEADPDGSAAVARALGDAAATIDATIGARYALPLAGPAPALLTRIACDLATAALATSADQLTELLKEREKRARADLVRIARGEMTLGLPTPGGDAGPGPQPIVTTGNERRFTRDSLRDL